MTKSIPIEDLRSGREVAFRDMVIQHQRQVYNTCMGFLRSTQDAEDVSQEVFIEVYKSIADFREDAQFSTWLYRIAVNKSLEFLRKKKRKKRFAFFQSVDDQEIMDRVPDQDIHPGVALEDQERSKVLFSAIEKLPEQQRVAFTLHKMEGCSYQEVCEIMGKSLSSVESLMFRARKNLQKSLKTYYELHMK